METVLDAYLPLENTLYKDTIISPPGHKPQPEDDADITHQNQVSSCEGGGSQDVFSRKILLFSSCIFLTNVVSAYYKKDYIYGLLFSILFITSLLVHSNMNMYTNCVDKMAIIGIVLYGLYTVQYKTADNYNNTAMFFIFLTFFSTIYLYIYGYCIDSYCFHPKYGNIYHSLLHIISSIGHHIIILM